MPRVGLLNIGEEPEKGDERSVETYQLLAATPGTSTSWATWRGAR